ncbi:hypothetical protein VTI74DRAFT_10284 [Chaetomium olivicolor]
MSHWEQTTIDRYDGISVANWKRAAEEQHRQQHTSPTPTNCNISGASSQGRKRSEPEHSTSPALSDAHRHKLAQANTGTTVVEVNLREIEYTPEEVELVRLEQRCPGVARYIRYQYKFNRAMNDYDDPISVIPQLARTKSASTHQSSHPLWRDVNSFTTAVASWKRGLAS